MEIVIAQPVPPEARATDGPAGLSAAKGPAAALAYVCDAQSEAAMTRSFADLGFVDSRVVRGKIDVAIDELARRGAPRFLIVDVSGTDEPVARIRQLVGACGSETRIVAIGDINDIALYREIKAAGVAEYIFKPLTGSMMTRVLGSIMEGTVEHHLSQTGKLVLALGVRGGVGTTTVATQTAWVLAEQHERYVLMLDLDLQSGDAAHQLDAQPNHALLEALDHPALVDDLFLDRGTIKVTPHLRLLAAREPLSGTMTPPEDQVLELLGALMRRYRFVIVDLPMVSALKLPKVVKLANTVLLVSDGTLISAQEVGRWRDRIGPDARGRSTLHVLNKKGSEEGLPEAELVQVLGRPPEVAIPYDRRFAKASRKGTKALYASGVMLSGLTTLARELTGASADPPPSRWQRWFGA